MGWFNRSATCDSSGSAIAKRCLGSIKRLPKDDETQMRELLVLVIIAHRLGIQFSSLPSERKERILNAFDRTLLRKLDSSVDSLLDQRGEQYFKMFNAHSNEIRQGNSGPFATHLSFSINQFCLGGDSEEGSPIIMGDDFINHHSLGLLAVELFMESFSTTQDLAYKTEPCN